MVKAIRTSPWRLLVPGVLAGVSPGLRNLIADEGSLTDRLIGIGGSGFRVNLLSQKVRLPSMDESACLGFSPRRWMSVREVLLMCDETPWVFARSVIPLTTLHGRYSGLGKLGVTPLGKVLFSDPGMSRGSIEVAEFRVRDSRPGAAGENRAIGRRSLFFLDTHPLLVAEIFLEDLARLLR